MSRDANPQSVLAESLVQALRVFHETASVDALDVCISGLSLIQKNGSMSSESIAEECRTFAVSAGVGSLDNQIRKALPAWLDTIGRPVAEEAARLFDMAPVDDGVLGCGLNEGTSEKWRELLVAAFDHRDALDVAQELATEEAAKRHILDLASIVDDVFRRRLLRTLFINDTRAAIAAGFSERKRGGHWWWTQLADLPSDALAQWVLGELQLPSSVSRTFIMYLEADPKLARFLDDWKRADARLTMLREELASAVEDSGEGAPSPERGPGGGAAHGWRDRFKRVVEQVAAGAFSPISAPQIAVLGESDRVWELRLPNALASLGRPELGTIIVEVRVPGPRVTARLDPSTVPAFLSAGIDIEIRLSASDGKLVAQPIILKPERSGRAPYGNAAILGDPESFAGQITIRATPSCGDEDGE